MVKIRECESICDYFCNKVYEVVFILKFEPTSWKPLHIICIVLFSSQSYHIGLAFIISVPKLLIGAILELP